MNQYKKNHKGFTLVELLAVIAIIGILAAVGLASLTGGKERAKDRSTAASMNSILIEASYFRGKQGDYAGLCADTTTEMDELLTTIGDTRKSGGVFDCDDEASKFGVIVELYREYGGSSVYYCVDSTKFFGERSQSTLSAKQCPNS